MQILFHSTMSANMQSVQRCGLRLGVVNLCEWMSGVYLPSLQQERAVHRPQPHDGVARLEVAQAVAARVQEQAQALEQLGRGGLDDGLARDQHGRAAGGQLVVAHHVVVERVGARHVGRRRGRGRRPPVHALHRHILVAVQRRVVRQRRAERRYALALAFQLLLVVVGRGKPLPRERVYEQRVLLEVLLQRRLLRDDLGGVVEGGAALVARQLAVLAVLGVVEALVGVGERGAVRRRRGGGRAPLARAEAQHGAHEARARAAARCPHASRSRPAAAAARVGSIAPRLRPARPLSTAARALS